MVRLTPKWWEYRDIVDGVVVGVREDSPQWVKDSYLDHQQRLEEESIAHENGIDY